MSVGTSDPLVQQASKALNLPASVVAAQINEESGGQAGVVSSAGAEGEFQFLPSTYTGLGFPAGTEFDPSEEVKAYITFMKELLQWSGGNVQKALAGYNAGEANWQAGLDYANTILGNAGQQTSLDSGGGKGGGAANATTTSANLIPGWLQGILGAVPGGQGLNELGGLLDPGNWIDWLERGALMLFGGILIIVGLIKLTSSSPNTPNFGGDPMQKKSQGSEEGEGASEEEAPAIEETGVLPAEAISA